MESAKPEVTVALELGRSRGARLWLQRGGSRLPIRIDPVTNEAKLAAVRLRDILAGGRGLAFNRLIHEPENTGRRREHAEQQKQQHQPGCPIVAGAAESVPECHKFLFGVLQSLPDLLEQLPRTINKLRRVTDARAVENLRSAGSVDGLGEGRFRPILGGRSIHRDLVPKFQTSSGHALPHQLVGRRELDAPVGADSILHVNPGPRIHPKDLRHGSTDTNGGTHVEFCRRRRGDGGVHHGNRSGGHPTDQRLVFRIIPRQFLEFYRGSGEVSFANQSLRQTVLGLGRDLMLRGPGRDDLTIDLNGAVEVPGGLLGVAFPFCSNSEADWAEPGTASAAAKTAAATNLDVIISFFPLPVNLPGAQL